MKLIVVNGLPVSSNTLAVQKDKAGAGSTAVSGMESFANQLKTALEKVNESQLQANEVTKKFLAGEIQDVHQVMIAMQEARLTMQLAVEVRNKLVESYQEISRMQV